MGFALYMDVDVPDRPALPGRPLSLEEKRKIEAEIWAALAARSHWRVKAMRVHLRRAQALASPSGDSLLLGFIGSATAAGCHSGAGEYNILRALRVLRESPTAPLGKLLQ